ncbi:sigma-70 family RNA polymerase sigma factor [Yersinia nurmii]|uniref:DNA-binding protein n=1 Tax=Yersinia nurmii TaxID=685706 RepID=A0AAW7K3W4_9GAMM|nr:sigma-70 family RNA polymerase sigma factor [Yersinia nurmii]MDN0089358.1 sigma-70 family RNA polymerase sigma factor [Yersinia nurmii]CNE75427.1 putative DNA-binding protein [Yersinia nurmii]
MDKPPSNRVSLAYQATYGQLVSFFRKRLDNASDAKDLSQDVFTLWLKRARQTPVEHSRAFLFKIAHRVLIDHWRATGKQRLLLSENHEDSLDRQDIAPAETEPQRLFEHQQRLNRLEDALQSLSPRRREAFLMHRFDGLSQIEVAERMGISVSMVEKHIAGALVHCKRYVAEQESEHNDGR